jgi:homoserine O-acetyltransferase
MSEIGRRAIMADPDWQDGDYYGTGRRPDRG